jgi:hypothetical protein
MIKVIKVSDMKYRIEYQNGSDCGEFLQDVDGYYYWWPPVDADKGHWDQSVLKQLVTELEKLNEDWDTFLKHNLK